jgi:hypothetical protein
MVVMGPLTGLVARHPQCLQCIFFNQGAARMAGCCNRRAACLEGYDDYKHIDVKGKIAAVLFGAPDFPAAVKAHYSASWLKRRNAAAHGAVGYLLNPAKIMAEWERNIYHHPQDDMQQPGLNFDAAALYARTAFLCGWFAGNDAAAPAWKPGDFFGVAFARPAAGMAGK